MQNNSFNAVEKKSYSKVTVFTVALKKSLITLAAFKKNWALTLEVFLYYLGGIFVFIGKTTENKKV